MNATILRHTFLRVDGLAVLRPQAFAFNMHWKFWDLAILLGFQLSRLASLKIPIRSPSNCTLLGQALSHMSGLRSLTLTDLPDRPHFLRVFPRLGQGILARKASLRELDISMTNFNRPHYGWEGDEVMIKPEIVGYLFSQIFPISRSWIAARTQQRFADPRDSIHKDVESRWHGHGPLKLEKLRLRHVGIPAYAFRHILDASHLKELRIPYCDVAPEAWETLQSEAQLVVLENIDYELLPDTLVDFLQSQTSLESLSFSRPTNVYSFADLHQFSPNVFTMLMKMEREASWLGPGTAWGAQYTKMSWRAAFERCRGYYSTLDELMASLRHTSLKQLVLPADMYDISADFVSAVGCELKSLEYICWAFDYGSWVSQLSSQKYSFSDNVIQEHRMAFMESFLPNVPHLRKITFLSLDRPSGLHDFDAPTFHQFIDSLGDLVPSTLKHIRYCHLSPRCYTGEFRESDVYYHRLTPVDGEWWLLVEGKEGEDLFKEGRTPQIVHVQ